MRALRVAASAAGFVASIIALACFPVLLRVEDGAIALNFSGTLDMVSAWGRGLIDGSSFLFRSGPTTWSFVALAPRFAFVSFLYLLLPGFTGLACGFFTALIRDPERPTKARGVVGGIFSLVFAIPDFMLAVLLQLAAIAVLDATGLKVFRISHDADSGILLALPFIVMGVYPFIHAFRMSERAARRAASAYYVLNAKARGVSGASLRFKHIGSAVLASLSTELPSILAIMMSSIFMVEYTFSLPGLTRWLFTVAFSGRRMGWFEGYQFPLALNILFCLALIYLLALATLKAALRAIKEILTHAL